VYQKGQETGVGRLAWYERGGSQSGFVGDPGRIFDFALSPDGKRVAIARADQQMKTSDLWIREIERGTETRLTSNASINERPVWSLDGAWIFFSSTRAGRTDLYHRAANGGAPEEALFQDKTTRKLAMDLDLGGKLLLFQSQRGIFALPLSGEAKPLAVVTSKFTNSQPQLSTNGRWMAYVSDESGRNEIYVRPFSADGNAPTNTWTISNTGGTDPRWRRDGSELFYVSGDGKLMSVHVKTTSGSVFAHDPAQPLFELPPLYARVAPGSFRYSVTGDGKHFLVLTGPKDAVEEPLTVITDWQRLLRR
jgi:Tol biopolymer transport system component